MAIVVMMVLGGDTGVTEAEGQNLEGLEPSGTALVSRAMVSFSSWKDEKFELLTWRTKGAGAPGGHKNCQTCFLGMACGQEQALD